MTYIFWTNVLFIVGKFEGNKRKLFSLPGFDFFEAFFRPPWWPGFLDLEDLDFRLLSQALDWLQTDGWEVVSLARFLLCWALELRRLRGFLMSSKRLRGPFCGLKHNLPSVFVSMCRWCRFLRGNLSSFCALGIDSEWRFRFSIDLRVSGRDE